MEMIERREPRDDILNFVEHCILVAANAPGISDGEDVRHALRNVAEAFWPDLLSGAFEQYNGESEEIEVETSTAIYYLAVRAVTR